MFPVAWCVARDHHHAERGNLLGHDVVCGHAVLPDHSAEPGLDSAQLAPVLLQFLLQLRAPQGEHAAHLFECDPGEQPPDLGEGEA
jgi:hypothetical protein